jgi:hypothetical protein
MNPSDGELVARHRRGVELLGELLERAGREGLPAVTWWSVGSDTAVLTGYIRHGSRTRRQAAFEAWRAALELDHSWDNQRSGEDALHLYARRTDEAELPVLLCAELVSDEEAGR